MQPNSAPPPASAGEVPTPVQLVFPEESPTP